MSNLPPNPYNITNAPQMNANSGPQFINHGQPMSHLPPSQLPPGFTSLKQDSNSNSPLPPSSAPQNNMINQVNNYSHSASSSPAFNHPGMMPPGLQSSPLRPPIKPPMSQASNQSPLPPTAQPLARQGPTATSSPLPYPPSYQQKQINDNAPPIIPSSHSQPLTNGPPMAGPQQIPVSSNYNQSINRPPVSGPSFSPGPINPPFSQQQNLPPQGPPMMKPSGHIPMGSQPNIPFSGPPNSGPLRNSPLVPGPPMSGPSVPPMPGPHLSTAPMLGQPASNSFSGPPKSIGLNGPSSNGPPISALSMGPGMPPATRPTITGFQSRPPLSGPLTGPSLSGLPAGPQMSGPPGPPMSGPPSGLQMSGAPPGPPMSGPLSGPPMSGPQTVPPMSGPTKGPLMPPTSQPYLGPPRNGPPGPAMPPQPMPPGPQAPPTGQGPTLGPNTPAMGHQMGPPSMSGPTGLASGPTGPPVSNMQGRYPQMPQGNYVNHQPMPPQPGKQYIQPQQQYAQGITQQMGQLSVTKQGFDQLWGHQQVDLMASRHILPEYPEDPPEIRLQHQFAEAPNCSPDIFRCTVNKIPDTNNLLQKSRLPLGILIHPFKDLNHLPVIQCTTIVRCRACRTYINPFVYFLDAKRWKCNLCYRANDLPEEFQYDPVSKSYGDPSRRPEIKSATIEFIAPGEYMLRPPQPAVYLFLMDVSQIARDSGYLQVVCDTLKSNLEQLPGDARTQVGFVCYDAAVHFYLMSDGLTRPKEMTVLDVDDVFLPSPESLLVNLGERKELVRELLTVLPQRHAGPGSPASALGAALQAAYKLMAPTGGRVTVFQTCLPNAGPGALQSREDPNARSASDVQHLNPATDFYKRLALDCSGAQVGCDLFLLSQQYADLATLSGMSKFSAGSVYHLPLFKASRGWQADQLQRVLTRYLTRKIGFEAVMRVRCTRGISIHTFHGNFFVRSTDLLSLPNVSPDAGFGMQLTIEESLADLQQVCFQAALLYTSSKGERRIRVHTLALPVATSLTDVLHSADTQCIIGLLSKMAVDRCATASMSEAREALMNVAVDALSAHKLAANLPSSSATASLLAPASLRLLPLYLLALLKRKAFRTGTSTRLDDRVADMCDMKTLPLYQLMRCVYPDLYPIHSLRDCLPTQEEDTDDAPDPPRLHLSAERINSNGAYLLDDGETLLIYVCHAVSPAFLSDTFGVAAFSQLPDDARSLPRIDAEGNALLHAFIDKLNDDRPYASNILLIKDTSPSKTIFTERLVDDRVESSFAYYEFLQHIKMQVK